MSKAIPILKQGKPTTEPLSYRTVNLLPTISKIIDRIVAKQTIEFLVQNSIITTQHHGGVKGKSTVTAIMSEVDEWSEQVESGAELAVIVIDQSAAYDMIDHEILIKKINKLGFSVNTLNYFRNYLNNRRQQIHIENTKSDELHIGNMSIVQGSTLSCLLYLIYTMDLPQNSTPHKKLKTKTQNQQHMLTTPRLQYNSIKTTLNTKPKLTQQLQHSNDYMNANLLTMNDNKTQLLIITKNINTKERLKINTTTKVIKPISNFKYLGIYM